MADPGWDEKWLHGDLVGHEHLGGYIAGGDNDTYCPDLWRWLVLQHGVRSVLDVGCGEGHAIDFFHQLGVHALGIDGVEQASPHIATHDFTTGPYTGLVGNFDLVWSCEFVEHVEARYVPNFIDAFKAAPLVLMTHALPGQPGWHHVNCQPADYWIAIMADAGYTLDQEMTHYARALCPDSNYFSKTGLAFHT